jgi:hypothetical protein
MANQAVDNFSFGVDDLLDSIFIATSNTAGVRLCNAARIKRVSVWGPALSAQPDQSGEVAICWNDQTSSTTDDFGAPGIPITDVPLAVTDIPKIHTRPPRGSPAAMWQSSPTSTVNLFGITCPAATVMDLTIEYIVLTGPGGGISTGYVPIVRTLAGATIGQLYNSIIGNFVPFDTAAI